MAHDKTQPHSPALNIAENNAPGAAGLMPDQHLPESRMPDAAQEALEKAGQTEEAAKKAARDAGEKGASNSASTAVASTGAGIPASGAIRAAGSAKRGLDNFTEETVGESVHLKDIFIFIAGFFVVVLMLGAGGVHGNIGSTSEKYSEDQLNETSVTKNLKGFKFIFKAIQKKFVDDGESVGEWDSQYPLKESLDKNMVIIRNAFDMAYKIAEEDEIPYIILQNKYDYALTMESFYSNGNPFDNANYAEFLSLISQKDKYNIENVKYTAFKKLMKASKNNENLKYLYCMKVEDAYATVRYYNNALGSEVRLAQGKSPPARSDGTSYEVHEKEVLYGQVTLRHYDLKSIYEMLDLEPNEKNKHWNANNIDMLDFQEMYIRFYARDYDLGSQERSPWTWGFDRENDDFMSLSDYEDFMNQMTQFEDGTYDERLDALMQYAMSKLGTKYSQAKRNSDGYFDCSSFVAACYRQLGIQFGSYSPTAAEICRYCENSGTQVSGGFSNNLSPGDVIFYSSGSNGRYKNVTHVALYVGNGMITDASSSKGQVVYRKIWGTNQIVSVCRPLQQ